MHRFIWILLFSAFFCAPLYASHSKQIERIENATTALEEISNIPEQGIPKELIEKSECIAVIPAMKKAAFGFGGNYGRGILLCRIGNSWSPPVMISIAGGSFGLQLGGTSTDLVLLVMNRKGIGKLLQSKLTLGGDASAAAGPVGRTAAAATDAQLHAEILAYARSRGLFAGISLNGSVLKPSRDDNEDLYGYRVNPKRILFDGGHVPSAALGLIGFLSRYPHE